MKKIILAVVLLLAASLNAEVLDGKGVSRLGTNITGRGLVRADALPRRESSCGCGLFSFGCGC
jgi:hypothetical protein